MVSGVRMQVNLRIPVLETPEGDVPAVGRGGLSIGRVKRAVDGSTSSPRTGLAGVSRTG